MLLCLRRGLQVKVSMGIDTYYSESVAVGSFFFNGYFKVCNVNEPCKLQEGVEYDNLKKKYMVLYRALIASGRFSDKVSEMLYRKNALNVWQDTLPPYVPPLAQFAGTLLVSSSFLSCLFLVTIGGLLKLRTIALAPVPGVVPCFAPAYLARLNSHLCSGLVSRSARLWSRCLKAADPLGYRPLSQSASDTPQVLVAVPLMWSYVFFVAC